MLLNYVQGLGLSDFTDPVIHIHKAAGSFTRHSLYQRYATDSV
jgi:hypothetical protein